MTIPVRWAAAALSAGLLVDAVTGRAELLVRPWFVPVLAAAGVALAAAAVRARGRMPLSGFLALLVPIAIGATLTPAVAGNAARASSTAATITSRLGDPSNPLLNGAGGHVTLLQILLAEQQGGGVVLSGRAVTVEAMAAGPHRLERSAIVCCAADAQAITLDETGPALPHPGTWVRVDGVLATVGDKTVLDVRHIVRIPTPTDPFL